MSSSKNSLTGPQTPKVRTRSPTPPPPPPMPLTLLAPPSSPISKPSTSATTNLYPRYGPRRSSRPITAATIHEGCLQEQLAAMLEQMNKKKMKLKLAKTPDIYFNQNSTPADVQKWLQLKAFPKTICRALKNKSGKDLLEMTKSELEQYFGQIDGGRLDGQITLSRNVCGYFANRTTELKSKLDKALKRVENKEQEQPKASTSAKPEKNN